jgi:quinoprotein glucose dehydrogenase
MRLLATVLWTTITLPVLYGQSDWPMYGHDPAATRYSPVSQINTSNVSKLVQAWVYDTKPAPDAKQGYVSKTTALVVNGTMYFATPFQSLLAMEPETGKVLWKYEHKYDFRASRGLAYWPGDRNNPPTIFFGTDDGFLIALNSRTGKQVPGFGKEGLIDLKAGMKDNYPFAQYGLQGAPAVYKNLVITGSHVQDGGSLGGKGDVRAWDTRSGKLVWTFHNVPQPGETGHETWLNDGWKDRSGVNVWNTFSFDTQTGTVFLPIGSPSNDLYGADRPGNNLFGNSLVALDAATGKLKWYFQTVHHDLWDYDLPPQPTMVDVVRDGKKIPALVQSGKTGLVFILDRRDGKPIYGVEERPVPKGDVPGEWYSPTQPFPLKPPPLARMSWKPGEIAKLTPEHQRYCEDLLKDAQNDGPYTPARLAKTVVFPGSGGGPNWGGGTLDPTLGYFIVNTHDSGAVVRMVAQTPAAEPQQRLIRQGDTSQMSFVRRNAGSLNFPDTGWPCQAPPWGELVAINVNTGDVAWKIPFGRVDALEALGIMNTGSYNMGGSVATAGGLLFIGATSDQRFHAFETKTGRLLWETKLTAALEANPITYVGKNGKQYVVIDANDKLYAFSLP